MDSFFIVASEREREIDIIMKRPPHHHHTHTESFSVAALIFERADDIYKVRALGGFIL